VAAHRESQLAIDNNANRVSSRNVTYGESGVVSGRRIDTDHDGIVRYAKFVYA
jgi:hypothetical protein